MVAGPSNAALEEIANAEVATDLPYVGGFALVRERSVASDHEAPVNPVSSRGARGLLAGIPQLLQTPPSQRQPPSAHQLPKQNGTEKPALVFAIVVSTSGPAYARPKFLPGQ